MRRVESPREHRPPDPAALHPREREELREEMRLPPQDRDRVANDPPSDDCDVEAVRVCRERVAEEREQAARGEGRRPQPLAAAQVPEGPEAQTGARGEITRACRADTHIEAWLGHEA